MDAIGYRRLSDKDQSNSLESQLTGIERYCSSNNLHLKKVFTDNGRSAFTFNRPEWIALEKYLKANKSIKYLIIFHIDRFSRATLLDALLKLREIEDRLNVKVLTVTDAVDRNNEDIGNQLNRIMQLLFSNNEYNRIKQRVKDGIYNSLCRGRYCGLAPYGYQNTKLSKEEKKLRKHEPVMVPVKEQADIIKQVFTLYNDGVNIEQIKTLLPALKKLRSKSAVARILSNPLYAGIIAVPANGNNPAFEVDAIHEPLVSKLDYYKAMNRLNKKTVSHQAESEVWLRGVLYCTCGRKMTAGNSKGRHGKYYWYYKCNSHPENNYSATKLHGTMLEILQILSLSAADVETIKYSMVEVIKNHQNNKGGNIMRLNIEHQKAKRELEKVQEKFLTADVDAGIYNRVTGEIKERISGYEVELAKAGTETNVLFEMLDQLLPKLLNLPELFLEMPLHKQQSLLNILFQIPLTYNGIYRTPKLYSLFAGKALILKEKGLLLIEQPFAVHDESTISTPDGTLIQKSLERLHRLLAG